MLSEAALPTGFSQWTFAPKMRHEVAWEREESKIKGVSPMQASKPVLNRIPDAEGSCIPNTTTKKELS